MQKKHKKRNNLPQWKQPELILLMRGRPEEAVLAGCKGVGGTIINSMSNHGNCRYGLGDLWGSRPCNACNSVTAS